MPKATLEFNLPEEDAEHRTAVNAGRMAIFIDEIRNKLRGYCKYGHEFTSADDAVDRIYSIYCDALTEMNIEIE